MVINIIDRAFDFLGQIDAYESYIASKSYSGIGAFELHLSEDANGAEYLTKENIIFTDADKAYVILHREINSTTGTMVVKGQDVKSLLARKITYPPTGQAYHRVNGDAETIMKSYVQAMIDRTGLTDISVATNQNRGSSTIFQTRYKNLAEELEKISLATGIGWKVSLDITNKQFVFDILQGQDRTSSQSLLPPAIFSVEYDNIGEQEYIESKFNYANVAIVGGQGSGADRAISVVGSESGWDAYETFIDARDIEDDTDLPERGMQKLAEMQEVITFDSQVLTDRNLIYGEDFNLGDIVTVQNKKWSLTLDTRIVSLTEIYEVAGDRLEITFGNNIPTIMDVVRQKTDEPIVESVDPSTDSTLLRDEDIGVTVQGYDADTVIDPNYVHTDNNYTTTEKDKLAGLSDTAAVIATGTYTGDGTTPRDINIGFQPDLIYVSVPEGTTSTVVAQIIMTTTSDYSFGGEWGSISFSNKETITSTGLTLSQYTKLNEIGVVYKWVAFKAG